MKKSHLLAACALVVACTPAFAAQPARTPERVAPERTWNKQQPAPIRWRAPHYAPAASKLEFRELSPQRVEKLHSRNRVEIDKPRQVGIARGVLSDAVVKSLPRLNWSRTADGGLAARIEVRSPRAAGLRVGLVLKSLDPRAELRFAGSGDAGGPTAMAKGREALALANGERVYWTPSTNGATQIIEIYLPPKVSPQRVQLDVSAVSHFVAGPADGFKSAKAGESGACNVDTACRVNELGTNFAKAKDSVAHMIFVEGGGSYICTGTLLADTVTTTQVPYFYSAHHCISSQTTASTLETVWKLEATSCGSGIAGSYTTLSGGATYLYSDETTDALLLRLNSTPPAGSTFSGWDSSPLAMPANVMAIHHPKGDLKKVSLGQQTGSDASQIAVGWTSGTTEGGSSGSGLFTSSTDGYLLRGGLYGGSASCANSGSVSNLENRDYYSRFDVAFPHIRQYLAPVATTRRPGDFNGDGKSDVLWRHAGTGSNAVWLSANNTTPLAISGVTNTAWKILGSGDFNADGKADIFWRNTSTGTNAIWLSANINTPQPIAGVTDLNWTVPAVADFNGDGKADLLWRNQATGANTIWLAGINSTQQAMPVAHTSWRAVAAADFNGDGKADILWRNASSGANALWRSGSSTQTQTLSSASTAWAVAGSGDFNGDGKADILWRNATSGANAIWLSGNSATVQTIASVTNLAWEVAAVGDYNGDGKSDVVWRNDATGQNVRWLSANSATPVAMSTVGDPNWKVVP